MIDEVKFNTFFLQVPDARGIGADADNEFLRGLEKVII